MAIVRIYVELVGLVGILLTIKNINACKFNIINSIFNNKAFFYIYDVVFFDFKAICKSIKAIQKYNISLIKMS